MFQLAGVEAAAASQRRSAAALLDAEQFDCLAERQIARLQPLYDSSD